MTLPNPHHRENSKSQFADDTTLWAASKNVQFAVKHLRKDLRKSAKWCAKWRIKLNPEKTKVIIFSRSPLARKSEPVLKLYGERLKIYPQVKYLGTTFDSKLTFQKHFEEILGHCNTRYHRVKADFLSWQKPLASQPRVLADNFPLLPAPQRVLAAWFKIFN